MTAPIQPTNYDIQVYALGQAGPLGSDAWLQWGGPGNPTFGALTVSFVSGLAVKSLWFPDPQGPMSFYAGDSATGTPFYVTDGSVGELVSIPNDAPVVTITGPATAFYFYASTIPYTPFRTATPPTVDVTVTAPITNSGTGTAPILGLATPLAVMYGGSGSVDPSLLSGTNVVITGSWPNQTISVIQGAGGVQSVGVDAPIILSGTASNPIIGLETPLPQNYGGTGIANPWAKGGTGIDVNGSSGINDSSFQWIISNTGVLGINPAALGLLAGNILLDSDGGTIAITNPTGNKINLETSAAVSSLPVYAPGGSQLNNPHIVASRAAAYSVSFSGNTIGSTTVSFVGAAQFTSGASYAVIFAIQGVTGSGPPVFVLEANSLTAGGFTVVGYGTGGTGAGNINFDVIAIGY
jgi:hypothetical protein